MLSADSSRILCVVSRENQSSDDTTFPSTLGIESPVCCSHVCSSHAHRRASLSTGMQCGTLTPEHARLVHLRFTCFRGEGCGAFVRFFFPFRAICCRYHIDHEAVPEFDEQRYWHECLTPTNFKRKTTPLSYNSWNGAMKKAYAELNLSYKKTTHVFRSSGMCLALFVLRICRFLFFVYAAPLPSCCVRVCCEGSKMAALGGCRPDEIRQHGRWNQASVFVDAAFKYLSQC